MAKPRRGGSTSDRASIAVRIALAIGLILGQRAGAERRGEPAGITQLTATEGGAIGQICSGNAADARPARKTKAHH